MNVADIRFTDRLKRVIRLAEAEATRAGALGVVPEHLLIAFYKENTGVLSQLNRICFVDQDKLLQQKMTKGTPFIDFEDSPFKLKISTRLNRVLLESLHLMRKNKHNFLSESHVMKALILDGAVSTYITEQQKETMLAIAASPRHLHITLEAYQLKEITHSYVRKANEEETLQLVTMLERDYSRKSAEMLRKTLHIETYFLYVSVDDESNCLGFIAFEVMEKTSAQIRLMFVFPPFQQQGVGTALLHACFNDIKLRGCSEAVVLEAESIEFFEKVGQATLLSLELLA